MGNVILSNLQELRRLKGYLEGHGTKMDIGHVFARATAKHKVFDTIPRSGKLLLDLPSGISH